MTDPTEELVRECFSSARAFFKGGVKAANKTYDPGVDALKADKAELRIAAGRILAEGGQRAEFPADTIGFGQVMRERGNTFGNCSEAVGVTASFAAELMPNVALTVVDAERGDHVFLVVGAMPVGELAVKDLKDSMPAQAKSYVIDTWAGICCDTRVYAERLAGKMDAWQRDGKLIVAERGGNEEEVKMQPADWGREVINSTVGRSDPHAFGTADDLNKLREYMDDAHLRAAKSLEHQEGWLRREYEEHSEILQRIQSAPREAFNDEVQAIRESLQKGNLDAEERGEQRRRFQMAQQNPREFLNDMAQSTKEMLEELAREMHVFERKKFYLEAQRSQPSVPPLARGPVAEGATIDSQAGESSRQNRGHATASHVGNISNTGNARRSRK